MTQNFLMFTTKQVSLVASAVASVALCGNAFAADATAKLTVSASIASECIISSGTAVAFGTYGPMVATLATAAQIELSARSDVGELSERLAPVDR